MNLEKYFLEAAQVKKDFIEKNNSLLEEVIEVIISCFNNGNKILVAWNWWSASDAQHFAAEFIWRYKLDKKSLPAIALTTDTSILTSIWNDYWNDFVYSKQVEWLWNKWDIFIGISTSWNSQNIVEAINIAKENGLITIWLTWNNWWKMHDMLDYNLIVESNNTPRIQECHTTIYHTICEEVENRLFT